MPNRALPPDAAALFPKAAALVAAGVLGLSGCINQWNTRLPNPFAPRGTAYDRREAQIQDPFPDGDFGPDVSARPREYNTQRSEQRRAKEQNQATLLRQQFGGQQTTPPDGGASMLGYPEAVRQ